MISKHETMSELGLLGEINVTEHRVDLTPSKKSIRSQPYRQGPAMREVVAKNVPEMLETDAIEPALSEWASPIVLVPKKDGSLRFHIVYRRLNAGTTPDAYPFPRIDDCLDFLGDAAIFTTVGTCNVQSITFALASNMKCTTLFA